MPKSFSLPCLCRSTKAFHRLCSNSNCNRLNILCSSNSHSVSNRIFSDSFSLNRSRTWLCKFGIWNSIGMTASSPNANRNGVVRILVLHPVWYAHSALCNLVSESAGSHLQFFGEYSEASCSLIPPIHSLVGITMYCIYELPHRMSLGFPPLDWGNVLHGYWWARSDTHTGTIYIHTETSMSMSQCCLGALLLPPILYNSLWLLWCTMMSVA